VAADGSGSFAVQVKICTCFGPATIQVKGVGETSGLSAQAPFTVKTNWPQFRMTPDHHGDNEFENVLSVPSVPAVQQLWTGPTTNFFSYSSAVAFEDNVYLGSGDHHLYVFAQDGCGSQSVCQPLWTGTMGGYIDSTPAAAGRVVLIGSDAGDVAAFPAAGCGQATCNPVWTATTGGSIHASPTIAGSYAFVVSGDALLHVYLVAGCGSSTCTDIWTGDLQGNVPTGSSAAVAGGRVYVGAGNSLLAFDAAGCGQTVCAPLWTASTGGQVFSSPAVGAGAVYVGSQDHRLYAFDAATGAPLWNAPTGDVIQSSPALAGGTVYVGSFDGGLYAFDAVTGLPAWRSATNGPIFSSPAVANGVLFVASNDGYLYAYDAAGCGQPTCGRLRRWAAPGEGSPAVSDSVVFVTGQDGNLYAFGLPGLAR
jgi:outer membrane protein assembly factor BamB